MIPRTIIDGGITFVWSNVSYKYVEDKKTTKAAGGTQDMINIFENNNIGNSTSDFLHSMSDITFILSLIPLIILQSDPRVSKPSNFKYQYLLQFIF